MNTNCMKNLKQEQKKTFVNEAPHNRYFLWNVFRPKIQMKFSVVSTILGSNANF